MAAEIVAQLPQLEALCERMYNSQNPEERAHAEQYLRVFGQSIEYIAHCKALLDTSQSPYAQLLATSSLLKVVKEHTLSVPVKLEMRTYFLSFLDSRGPALEPFVVTSLVQLLCRMTKLCWFDDDTFQSIVDDAKTFLEKGSSGGSSGHYLLGLKILVLLVGEMNQPIGGRTLTSHRKAAISFRDTRLFSVFQLALTALRQLAAAPKPDTKLQDQAVNLALATLSFDFVGTCLDESSEDLGTIQVPSSWRSVIEDPTTVQLFLDFYAVNKPPLSNAALECLVRLASVRRSLFASEASRGSFLNHLASGTRDILRTQRGLSEHANYHEFCRLLGRLKTNYQLSELVGVDGYEEWIQLVADLTVSSLASWQWASGSVYYLLGLWSRLISSMPYLKGDSPSLLDTYVPRINQAYITSRLDSVAEAVKGGNEDPLDNEEQMADQLDAIPFLCRFQYRPTADFLLAFMQPLSSSYKDAAVPGKASSQELEIMEGQLTWLVHLVGAIIKGRLSSSTAESQEPIDGDLAAQVLGLLQVCDAGVHGQRSGEHSRQRLDLALLGFFQSFRKVYVGEQVMTCSKVYLRLREKIGVDTHLAVLNIMVQKIAVNLKQFCDCEEVVSQTLTLFQDLATGFMSGKLLLKLDAVSFLLSHHPAEHFPFLTRRANMQSRPMFYATLARLLFMEDTPAKFHSFVSPLQQVLQQLAQASAGGTNPAALRQSVPEDTVAGLFRDLRGIAIATNNRKTYGLLFDWLLPAHFPVIVASVQAWADVPQVTTAILKFMAEFALNKTQRLTFDSSSPNGILLFREISKVLVTYGSRVLNTPPGTDPYAERYKGTWVCMLILARALSGNYVNFGVFDLYGDPAFKDAVRIALQLIVSVPLPDIMAFRKVSRSFFQLLEVLSHSHASMLAATDLETFSFLMSAVDTGLKSLDSSISSQCAATVDNLAGFYFKATHADAPASQSPPHPAAQTMGAHLRARPEQLPTILKTLFELVLFEDVANQWSISRPMLTLILVNEDIYLQLQQQIIDAQPADRRSHLTACLANLMVDVNRNLDPKNRDKFTQNLTLVRTEFKLKT